MKWRDHSNRGQRSSEPTLRQMAVLELIRTADQLRRYFTDLYEPHGITPQQHAVLEILRGAHPRALPTMEIATRMAEKTPGVTRLLDRLERKELLARERRSADRRQVLISITPAGLSLLGNLEEPVRQATTAVLAMFPAQEVQQLRGLLSEIRRTL